MCFHVLWGCYFFAGLFILFCLGLFIFLVRRCLVSCSFSSGLFYVFFPFGAVYLFVLGCLVHIFVWAVYVLLCLVEFFVWGAVYVFCSGQFTLSVFACCCLFFRGCLVYLLLFLLLGLLWFVLLFGVCCFYGVYVVFLVCLCCC